MHTSEMSWMISAGMLSGSWKHLKQICICHCTVTDNNNISTLVLKTETYRYVITMNQAHPIMAYNVMLLVLMDFIDVVDFITVWENQYSQSNFVTMN